MRSAILYGPLFGLMTLGLAAPAVAQSGPSQQFPTYTVGLQSDGSYLMSTGQIITPAGTLVHLGSPVRAKAVALNPTNTSSAAVLTMGASQAVEVINTANGDVEQFYSPFGDNSASFTGISYSPDGKWLLFSQDNSSKVGVAQVNSTTGLLSDYAQVSVPPSQAYINCTGITVGLPSSPINALCGNFYNGNTYTSNPAGIAVAADSKTAYVVLNQNNTLQAIDLTVDPPMPKGKQIRVGNAPNSVLVNGNFAYVSNEGGRVAGPNDFTNISTGTPIVASTENGSSVTGTVSVVDLTTMKVVKNIAVGLHPTGMTIAGGMLFVTNTNSDTITVVDLATNTIMRRISLALPIHGHPFGASPTGIVVVGSVAYVTLYTVNAIAVLDLSGSSAHPVMGYIPTASTPSTIAYDATHNQLVVTNDKGLGTQGSYGSAYGLYGYNSHQDTATVDLIPLANSLANLPTWTTKVYQNNHWDLTANIVAGSGGIATAAPVAIPNRIGAPSLIKHVFLIVRENRTYDQVLGDVPNGNGDPSLAIFGQPITPNMHAIVQRFPLLDNYYNPSRQSADGHNWLVQAMAPYMDDIQSPDWVRSYPANGLDALAIAPKSFLWDAAERMGLSVKIFGEYVEYSAYTKNNDPAHQNPSWSDYYNDALAYESGAEKQLKLFNTVHVVSEIPSVQKYVIPNFPPFDLDIPDQFRVDLWQQNFNADVTAGTVPALTTLWIMCDHTGGPPTSAAEQADNDLAVGRIISAISHSPVWGSSAIFITEDDAQAGVDHIDGHRSPGYVVSPYAVQFKGVDHTYYSQVNVTRTIEQILGLPPMNQFDLVASPMFPLFTNTPNLTPWSYVAAQVPLNQGVSSTAAELSPMAKAWSLAKADIFRGKLQRADAEDPYTVNHWNWYEATGFKRPYPGEEKVRWPSEFADRISRPYFDLDD